MLFFTLPHTVPEIIQAVRDFPVVGDVSPLWYDSFEGRGRKMTRLRISKAQIAKIWATARELGLDRDLLYHLVPGGHISRLTRAQAHRLIECLLALKTGEPLPPEPVSRRPPRGDEATPEQHRLIQSLLEDLGWRDNPRRAEGFLRKYAGVPTPEQIRSRRRAIAIIEALKAIRERQGEATSAGRAAPRDNTLGEG